jgi:polyhydroxybutyrate depolymerase
MPGPSPLVLALHGYTQDASRLEATTHFNDEAAQAGFVVAYPRGIGQSWNAGSCCGSAQSENIDDVKFIGQLIDRLVKGGQADPKRVFATGLSNGGMMVYRLACELSDRLAAVASVSGAMVTDACNPTRPISVLEIHGTQDAIVPFEGGPTVLGPVPSTISTMKRWAGIDGCAADAQINQSGIVRTMTWTPCRDGTAVTLDAVNGLGHSWFSAEPNATKVVWEFFSRLQTR